MPKWATAARNAIASGGWLAWGGSRDGSEPWLVTGRAQEWQEAVRADRRRHGVDQRVEVERLMPHHCGIEHDSDAPHRVVDRAERRHCAGLNAPHPTEQVRRAECE